MTDIEIPLSRVLAKMEVEGIRVDLEELERQKSFLEADIDELTNRIYQ